MERLIVFPQVLIVKSIMSLGIFFENSHFVAQFMFNAEIQPRSIVLIKMCLMKMAS